MKSPEGGEDGEQSEPVYLNTPSSFSGDDDSFSSEQDGSPDAAPVEALHRMTRLKGTKKKKKKSSRQRAFSVSIANLSARRSSSSVSAKSYAVLLRKNAALAASLNTQLQENQELAKYVADLREENLSSIFELAELREHLQLMEKSPEELEAELDRRLVEYLDPIRSHLSQAVRHARGLSQSLTEAMHLVIAPSERLQSTPRVSGASPASTSGVNSGKHQSAFSSKKRTVPAKNNQMIAHVTPRVRGYAIHKPQIEIPRLDMREIRRLQARARGDDSRNQQVNDDTESAQVENNVDTSTAENEFLNMDEEEEPSEPRVTSSDDVTMGLTREAQLDEINLPGERPQPTMSVIDEEEERTRESEDGNQVNNQDLHEQDSETNNDSLQGSSSNTHTSENAPNVVRSPMLLLEDVSQILDRYSLEDKSPNRTKRRSKSKAPENGAEANKETVLLLPRLILERITVKGCKTSKASFHTSTPSRSPSSKSTNEKEQNCVKSVSETSGNESEDTLGYRHTHDGQMVETEDTPRSRESSEKFFMRLLGEDPLEGPSWLFDSHNKPRQGRIADEILERKRRSSSLRIKAQLGECSKHLDLKFQKAAKHRGSQGSPFATPPRKSGPRTPETSKADGNAVVSIHQSRDYQEPSPLGSSHRRKASATSTTERLPRSDKSQRIDTEAPSQRPRRRAATAAIQALKEQSNAKKARNDGPNNHVNPHSKNSKR